MRLSNARSIDRVFGALADPTRRAIVAELARGERGATELVKAGPRRISQPAVSRHLRVLREAGLIEKRVHGRTHWCALRPEGFASAAAWIEAHRGFWEGRLDALAGVVEGTGKNRTSHIAHGTSRPRRRKTSKRSGR